MQAETKLTHVNAAAAQTWNWLRINERDLSVPALFGVDSLDELVGMGLQKTPEEFRAFLCGAGTQLGAWIDVSAEVRKKLTIPSGTSQEIMILLGEQNFVEQLCIHLEKNAHVKITVGAISEKISATNVRVCMDEGATCHYDLLCAKNNDGTHLDSFSATLGKGAHLSVHQYVFGSELALSGIHVELLEDDATFSQIIRYLGEQKQAIDIASTCIHYGKNTKSNIVATGVLDDDASKVFRATIDLSKGSKGAEGKEVETVVCAGKNVVNKTLPIILCSEDDVAGNHGATIGSLSSEQLFYLATRGISPDDAIDLLKISFFEEARTHLPKEFLAYIEKRENNG